MSVRFDSNADSISRTSNIVSTSGDCTFAGWKYRVNDRGSPASQVIWDIFGSVTGDFLLSLFDEAFDTDGAAGINSYENTTFEFNQTLFASRVAGATWAYYAVVKGGDVLTGYWSQLGDETWHEITCDVAAPASQNGINTMILSHTPGDWIDARAMWDLCADRAYSLDDLKAQKYAKFLRSATSINFFWKNDTAGNAGVDSSGNGRNGTVAGTLTTEADVPIAWDQLGAPGVLALAGATGLTQSAGKSDTLTAGALALAGAAGLTQTAGKSDTLTPGALTLAGAAGLTQQVDGVADTLTPGALALVGGAGMGQTAGVSNTLTAGVLALVGGAGLAQSAGASQALTPGALILAAAAGLVQQVTDAVATLVAGVLTTIGATGLNQVAGASGVLTPGVLSLAGASGMAVEVGGVIAAGAPARLRGLVRGVMRGVIGDA